MTHFCSVFPKVRAGVLALAEFAAFETFAGPRAVAARSANPSPHQQALDRAHAQALDSFRRARFSEAYGRFIKLAEAGHPASARYAIWMCENGNALFGVPWDCAPQELENWGWVARSMPAAAAALTVRGR
jgi:hypothetical protein